MASGRGGLKGLLMIFWMPVKLYYVDMMTGCPAFPRERHQQTLDIHPMLGQCWSSVADDGPTLNISEYFSYFWIVDLHFANCKLFSLTWSFESRQRDSTSGAWNYNWLNWWLRNLPHLIVQRPGGTKSSKQYQNGLFSQNYTQNTTELTFRPRRGLWMTIIIP